MAQQRVLEASDIVPGDDLIAIGKKVAKRRDGEQYEEFAMSIEEFAKASAAPINVTNYFVDKTFGDDNTALPNRFDKPYATLKAVHNATVEGVAALIYVRRGDYMGDVIKQKNNVSWYFEPGTIVTNMTFLDDGPKTFNVYGKADFVLTEGNYLLRLTEASTVTFEANNVTSTDRIFFFSSRNRSSVDLKLNAIYSNGADGSSGFYIMEDINLNINIFKEYIYGVNNGNATARAFEFSSSFDGICNIVCPLTKIITQQTAVYLHENTRPTSVVNYTGNIEMAGTSTTPFRFAVYVAAGNFNMVGNIKTSLEATELAIGILTAGAAAESTGTVKLDGSITGGGEALITTSSYIPVFLKNGTYSTAKEGNYYRSVINIGRTTNGIAADNLNTVYIKNGFIKTDVENEPIFFDDDTQKLYMYDVAIQLANAGDDTTASASGIPVMFCQSVNSNGKRGVATDPAGGYAEKATLIVPSF